MNFVFVSAAVTVFVCVCTEPVFHIELNIWFAELGSVHSLSYRNDQHNMCARAVSTRKEMENEIELSVSEKKEKQKWKRAWDVGKNCKSQKRRLQHGEPINLTISQYNLLRVYEPLSHLGWHWQWVSRTGQEWKRDGRGFNFFSHSILLRVIVVILLQVAAFMRSRAIDTLYSLPLPHPWCCWSCSPSPSHFQLDIVNKR